MRRVGLALGLLAILALVWAVQSNAQRSRTRTANAVLDSMESHMLSGLFPLEWSSSTPVTQLLGHGAEIDHLTPLGFNGLMIASAYGDGPAIEQALAAGIDVNACGSLPQLTPLCWAASTGEIESARLLLSRGAKVDKALSNGGTPLGCAAESHRPDMVRLLLAHGADANLKNLDGLSLIHCAIGKGDVVLTPNRRQPDEEVIELLIARGSAVNHIDKEGKTPLDLARDCGNTRVVALLKRHGGMAAWRLRQERAAGRKTRP